MSTVEIHEEMIGRDISFILGQHHPELDLAVLHHNPRTGFVLEVATMHESVGQEAIFLWYDRTGLLEEITRSSPIDLRVRCGLAMSEAGPVLFFLWWMPPVNHEGSPGLVVEQLLDPTQEESRQVLRKLANQKYLHLVLVGTASRVLGLHEFKNEFGFLDLYAYAEAASEMCDAAGYDFDAAVSSYKREFNLAGLLHDQYPGRALVVGDCPN